MMADNTTPNDLVDHLPGKPFRAADVVLPRRVPIWLIITVGVILVAVAGGVLYYLFVPLSAPIPDDVGVSYAGLEQGYTDEGFPRLGSTDASIVIEDFSSYACPHCGRFHKEEFPELLDEIATGQVQFVFIPVPHIGSGAENAAKAALCAGEQGKFWEMHDVLFYWQEQFIVRIFDERRIKKGAKNLGLDTGKFDQCLDDDANAPAMVIKRARNEFDKRHLTGTPSVFKNGLKVSDWKEVGDLGESDSGEGEEK